jgi:hypothetical protein
VTPHQGFHRGRVACPDALDQLGIGGRRGGCDYGWT